MTVKTANQLTADALCAHVGADSPAPHYSFAMNYPFIGALVCCTDSAGAIVHVQLLEDMGAGAWRAVVDQYHVHPRYLTVTCIAESDGATARPAAAKGIIYDQETQDYAMYLNGRLIGFRATYHAA